MFFVDTSYTTYARLLSLKSKGQISYVRQILSNSIFFSFIFYFKCIELRKVTKRQKEIKKKNPTHFFTQVYQFVFKREIIVLQSVLYFLNGPGCLNIAFFICWSTLFLVPPWSAFLRKSFLARGTNSLRSSLHLAIRRNSDMMEP